MRNVHVNAGKGYDIKIGRELLKQAGSLARSVLDADKVAIFTDKKVDSLYGDILRSTIAAAGLDVCTYTYPSGEQSKNIETISQFIAFMSENGLTRKDAVVALGGGVAGDMAGFAASIYMRGIDFIQIPTTLLAAVDSSVGGKTGVDTAYGKNLVGTFWQPAMVIYDTETFESLDEELFLDGMAEVIKTAAIRDESLFSRIEDASGRDDARSEVRGALEDIVESCVTIKGNVVDADEKEAGLRKILNFGHTMAHAIELDSGYTISHGRAVAMGMLMMTAATEQSGDTEKGTFTRLFNLCKCLGYETQPDAGLAHLCELAKKDKKARGERISLVGIYRIGEAYTFDVRLDELADYMDVKR